MQINWKRICMANIKLPFVVVFQDGQIKEVPNIQGSWIRKLFGFTVLKPTERSVVQAGGKTTVVFK